MELWARRADLGHPRSVAGTQKGWDRCHHPTAQPLRSALWASPPAWGSGVTSLLQQQQIIACGQKALLLVGSSCRAGLAEGESPIWASNFFQSSLLPPDPTPGCTRPAQLALLMGSPLGQSLSWSKISTWDRSQVNYELTLTELPKIQSWSSCQLVKEKSSPSVNS